MGLTFAPGLSACDVSGHLVFLDRRADRYFALAGGRREICLTLAAGDEQAVAAADIAALIASGVLCRTPDRHLPQLCAAPPVPKASARDRVGSSSPLAALTAIGGIAIAAAELRVRRFEAVLDSVAAAKQRARHSGPTGQDPVAVAAAFAAADRLVTALDRCLPRSIAVARAMIARGFDPQLVLAVKMRPFEAHCWVQQGDVLVSDHLGAVTPFTPILVI